MNWFTSSFSTSGNDQCVECRFAPGEGVHVRDTKHREAGSLLFSFDEWRVFVSATKAGEFDGHP